MVGTLCACVLESVAVRCACDRPDELIVDRVHTTTTTYVTTFFFFRFSNSTASNSTALGLQNV